MAVYISIDLNIVGVRTGETMQLYTHLHKAMVHLCADYIILLHIAIRGHPKMSTFSQVYKPYARGEGVTLDVRF